MLILAVETSCDETGLALIEAEGNTFRLMADALSSQAKLHAHYGGVYPNLAKREHIRNLPILYERLLKKSKIKESDISLLAVTSGPGLEQALWAGITFTQDLAKKLKVPVMPVNHMEGHVISPFVKSRSKFKIPKINFPILSLLVSGGHTELVLSANFMKYKIIGETLDDAAGEAFDKTARMLGLPYPGGPEISRLAEEARKIAPPKSFLQVLGSPSAQPDHSENLFGSAFNLPRLPRPMLKSKDFNFSFSGLKTAVLYLIRDLGTLNDELKSRIALEFENAVVETLVHKTKTALQKFGAKTLIVAGGVAANKFLRQEIKRAIGKEAKIFFPEKKLTTDNAIMIGVAGYLNYLNKNKKTINPNRIKADGGLRL